MFEIKQDSEVIIQSHSAFPLVCLHLVEKKCKCNHSWRMCVLIAIIHEPYTFRWEECWWFFQLNGNSCFWALCQREVGGALCLYLLWPQPWMGILQTTAEPAVEHSWVSCMLHRALSFSGKNVVCIGHHRVKSWDFTGQQISAGGFTSDYGRELHSCLVLTGYCLVSNYAD